MAQRFTLGPTLTNMMLSERECGDFLAAEALLDAAAFAVWP